MSDINQKLNHLAKSISVLYVEDDKETREQFEDIFTLFFKEIKSTKNGQEALEIYNKKQYDIIITDLTMPLMNGIDLISEILKIDSNLIKKISELEAQINQLSDVQGSKYQTLSHKKELKVHDLRNEAQLQINNLTKDTQKIKDDIIGVGFWNPGFVNGTLNSIIYSEQLGLIKNNELKNTLTYYNSAIYNNLELFEQYRVMLTDKH